MQRVPVWLSAVLLVLCSNPALGPMMYFRPYAAALLVGASLGVCPPILRRVLISRPMAYVAEVSYALYVVHGVLRFTWLGSGDVAAKYLKRPLLFGATFLIAHVSTRYYEQPITRAVRNWTKSRRRRKAEAKSGTPTAGTSRPAG
jgi:peptidoglycan/LPS O-acetylase OafA/YrhL